MIIDHINSTDSYCYLDQTNNLDCFVGLSRRTWITEPGKAATLLPDRM